MPDGARATRASVPGLQPACCQVAALPCLHRNVAVYIENNNRPLPAFAVKEQFELALGMSLAWYVGRST